MAKFEVGDRVKDISRSFTVGAIVMDVTENKVKVLWDDDPYSNWKEHSWWPEDDFELVEPESPWKSMSEAPTDGKHVLLAIKNGCFVTTIQGCYDSINKKWVNAADLDTEPLCWMTNEHRIPAKFLPWIDEYKELNSK